MVYGNNYGDHFGGKSFPFDHFGGKLTSAGCPIILILQTKMTDHFGGKLEIFRAQSFCPDHFGGKDKQENDHFGGRTFWWEATVYPQLRCNGIIIATKFLGRGCR